MISRTQFGSEVWNKSVVKSVKALEAFLEIPSAHVFSCSDSGRDRRRRGMTVELRVNNVPLAST